MKTYFRHFRLHNEYGEILPKGGMTLYVEENNHEDGYNITVSFAICSEKDHYNKRIGRDAAQGRYGRYSHSVFTSCTNKVAISNFLKLFAQTTFSECYRSKHSPTSLRVVTRKASAFSDKEASASIQ